MPALWIAHVTVTDTEAYGRYAALAGPAIAKHGGVFIARGGRFVQLEGKERQQRNEKISRNNKRKEGLRDKQNDDRDKG